MLLMFFFLITTPLGHMDLLKYFSEYWENYLILSKTGHNSSYRKLNFITDLLNRPGYSCKKTYHSIFSTLVSIKLS